MATPFTIHANLDCEARWGGVVLPESIRARISLYGALMAALGPPRETVEVWAPVQVDGARLLPARGWQPPVMVAGTPPRCDLSWADEAAKAANDRRFALVVAQKHGAALGGAKAIHRIEELDLAGPWVCKAPWTAAGRDRCVGSGRPTTEQRARLERLLEKFGCLILEPWCERIVDVGVCATVGTDGAVDVQPPHRLITDRHETFVGIDVSAPELEDAELDRLATLVAAAGAALAGIGYAGPFAVDAFAYRVGGARRFHPLCEINARFTFGWIARAFARRTGITQLGFGPAPPGAQTLIAPETDGVTAWIA
jgi:hypothetical protein